VSGKDAVVLGRSNIVGMPMSQLLLAMNATVTVCHSRTANIKAKCAAADIVIAAIGRAEMVRGDWIKPGAVVIDVGINSVDDATKKRGYRLTGDVCFEEAKAHAGAITPVRMLHRHHRAAAHPFIRLSKLTPHLPPETPTFMHAGSGRCRSHDDRYAPQEHRQPGEAQLESPGPLISDLKTQHCWERASHCSLPIKYKHMYVRRHSFI